MVTPPPGKSVVLQESPLSDFPYYRMMAMLKIESNFTLPRHLRAEGITCRIKVTILKDGRIENIRILKGTGDSLLDGYALRALQRTASLPPLPDTLKVRYLDLEFLFDYSLPKD